MNNLNLPPIAPQAVSSSNDNEYPWQVKPIAFQLAAGLLLANTVFSLIARLLGVTPNPISLIIDIILAIALFGLHPSARGFTLFRAYAGAILLPILAFTQSSFLAASITTIIQWDYSGSLILLL